ncbi:hypothetical protein SUGI_0904370 [Cryptomeria japonica]|nr:hypothetical protein SUGI_0904370 [Cryptomeria japonica]
MSCYQLGVRGWSDDSPKRYWNGGFGTSQNWQGFGANVGSVSNCRGLGFHPSSHPSTELEQRTGVQKRGDWNQGDSHSMPSGESLPHGREIRVPSTTTMVSMAKLTIVNLTKEVEKAVEHNEMVFVGLGLIGCFRGLWPNLNDLHKCISEHWKPIMDDYVKIYPHVRGFFVVATPQFYTVDKEEVNLKTPQDVGGLIKDTSAEAPEQTNVEQGLAYGSDGVANGGVHVGCSSIQVASGVAQKVEGGSSSRVGFDARLVEGT